MKKTLILIFIFTFSLSAFAGFVPLKNAEKVAKSHVYQTIASFEPLEWKDINLNCLFDPSQNDIYKFYVFNINGDQGYVIVSSDDQIIPILAYSFEGGFNFNNMSPGQAEFLNYFNKSIEYANNNEMPVNKKAVSQWQELLDFNQTKSFQLKATSPILLGEINWNQIWPYNSQCPTDPNSGGGLNGHVPVGCSAIALLQVMKYYNWPSTGTGSKTHLNDANGGYGDITINFAQQTYDWFSIPDQASDFENPELGKICFHAGVAVSMEWGPSGSGAFIHDVAEALKNHFKYNPSLSHVQKYSYSETDWKNLIKQQIDSKKPMIYAGYSTSLGHAWNCDGYQDDSFHMNWGWGGAGDGYYTLDNLTSSATPEGEEYNFILYNEMIINIYPDTGYPEYCQSEKLITGSEGSFDDGSGPEDYETNLSCVYEIIPNCESIVNLIFTNLDLGDGDVVELYDGDKNSTKLIATFDKYNPPTTDAYTSITGGMTIKFNTDASSQADGWKVQYAVESCKQNMIFTETQGNLSDGSKSCDYKNSTSCSWIIEPEGATHINLDFVSCEIADNTDYLKIYKNTINTSNLLYHFNKSTIPNGTITIPSGRAVLEFYTNSSGVDEGWELNYTSSASTVPPIANFIGNPTTIETEQYVNFTDLSTNCLAAWDWTFEGGTPPTSNEQNPTVYYMNAGTYNVSLTVSNGSQNFTETKNGYITVLPPSSGFTYDFEACPNFVVDQFSPCTTYDGDGSYTYGISGINFENAYYKGSFIAFNHSATEPASPSALSAHGGSKYGACFAAVNGPNNDWFITPKINLESNSSFSFWARSLTSQNGLERFNVLISTTDNNPSSFTKISTGTYTEASTTWTKYTYDLNAYNGQGVHCAIQCVSDVAFVFMIDDIEIATTPTNVDFTWTGDQCSENTLAFASGSAPAGSNYVWKVNGSIVNEGSPIFSHTFPTVSTATDFQVSLYVTSGSLTKDTTKTITIYPLPTVAISTANQDVCQGQPATLTASGATNYEWSTTETGNEINVTVNESTTFYVTGTDINSCTNTASINMTAIPITTTVVYNDLCEGDTYNFYGTNLTEQGTHYHTLTSLNTGCDSIIQLELTVNPTFLEETVDVICDSELPYTWQGEEYNETGEYEKIHQTVLGCDSVYTLYLTVNPTFLEETVDVICDSELPYTWQGGEYNETGEYVKTYPTVHGCDSVYKLNLTVNPTFLEETVDVICDSELPYTWQGEEYYETGEYEKIHQTVHGCDSIYKLNLTVNPTFLEETVDVICDSELPYTWQGGEYNETGEHVKTYQTVHGCDSVYKLNLIVNPTFTKDTIVKICDSELPYTWQGEEYNETGEHIKTYQTVHGCDSVYKLYLTINPTFLEETVDTICDSELPYVWRNVEYNATGIYNNELETVNGCDSIYRLNLTVNQSYAADTETHEICEGNEFEWHGQTYTVAGTYTASYENIFGCDSIHTLELIVYPSYAIDTTVDLMEETEYTWAVNGTTYYATGTYTASFETVDHLCDSIHTLHLYLIDEIIEHTICYNELPYQWENVQCTEAGNYYQDFGADGYKKLVLTVKPLNKIEQNDEICEGEVYTWEINGEEYEVADTYTYIHPTEVGENGCAVIYELTLAVNPLPEQVVILQDPENGILPEGTSGSITIENSIVGTYYWVTSEGEPITLEFIGTGSNLSLGENFLDGTYNILSRTEHNCSLVQGSVNFINEGSVANKIIANVTFDEPASNFPANHVKVKLYKETLDSDDNVVVVFVAEQLVNSDSQAEFIDLEVGNYYLASFVQYPEDYNVAEHVYYQNVVVHEDATIIPISEGTEFIANIHHIALTESQGSNGMYGIVGTLNNDESLNPLNEMVVVLKNKDIGEFIGVKITDENGQYQFSNIPENTNIQAFVTSLIHQNWTAFEIETTNEQNYNVNFIVSGTNVYPDYITMLEDVLIQNFEFTVFPNPAKEILYINCNVEKAIVQIFDINGKLVQTDLTFSNSEIDISELVPGTYLIILSAENGKIGIQKFVKE